MPFVKDFSTLEGTGTFDIIVPKWKSPLIIEYGYEYVNRVLFFFWRVQGTRHTFKISTIDVLHLADNDYEGHIQTFLEDFRVEYLGWIYQGLPETWMQEYHEEYKHFVEF